METMELDVAGMHCDGCEGSIKRALGLLDGVLAVTADHKTGKVIVDSERPLDRGKVATAVEDAGYEVLPEGRGQLPVI